MEIDRNIPAQPWEASNFLSDLPGKWEISQIALDHCNRPAGFLVGSLKPLGAHIDRVAVAEQWRRQGLGMLLMAAAGAAIKRLNIEHITCKVHENNSASKEMMSRLGWKETGREGTNCLMAVEVNTLIARGSEFHYRMTAESVSSEGRACYQPPAKPSKV